MDRASGSGVFARDPDAQLDLTPLEMTEDLKNYVQDGSATAWRLESNLREFPNVTPVNFWFEYPIHRVDDTDQLHNAFAEGSPMGNLYKSRKYTRAEDRRASIETAFQVLSMVPPVTVQAIADYLELTNRCVRDRLNEMKEDFWVKGGIVGRHNENP